MNVKLYFIENFFIFGLLRALVLDLSDIYQKQSQNNTVIPTEEEMDRVGFEPTTSAAALF